MPQFFREFDFARLLLFFFTVFSVAPNLPRFLLASGITIIKRSPRFRRTLSFPIAYKVLHHGYRTACKAQWGFRFL